MQADNSASDPIVYVLDHTPIGKYGGLSFVIAGILRICIPAIVDFIKSWRAARSGSADKISFELACKLAHEKIFEMDEERKKLVARIAYLESIISKAGLQS